MYTFRVRQLHVLSTGGIFDFSAHFSTFWNAARVSVVVNFSVNFF